MEATLKRQLLIIAAVVTITAGSSFAQNPPAQSGPNNNAVNSSGQNNSNAPVAGANSFTEGQAKSRIEGAGYSNVTDLKKDDNGVWRGKAQKAGTTTGVSIDFQGNVNPAK
jgi:hypothetical protein